MKLGISSYAFGWAVNAGTFRPDTLIEFAVAHRVPVVQFGDHVPLHRLEATTLENLARRASAAGVEIEVGARGLTVANLHTHVALGQRLGSRFLRFVIDNPGYEPTLDEISGVLRESLPALQQSGQVLGIENHDRFASASLRRFIDDLGSDQIGICLDTANSLGAGEGIREVMAHLAPVCVNLHAKDFAIARLPHMMGFVVTGRALGEGMLPLDELLETVNARGRCGTAVIETWPPPQSEMSATLAMEMDWATRSVNVLRAALAKLAHTATA